MKQITVNSYQNDKYYPRVVKAMSKILLYSDVVTPVQVLIEMGNLTKTNHDAWRCGKVPFLERVFEGNLSKANRILRLIRFHAHDLNMVPSKTVYHQLGNGKNRILRFSKSGDQKIEEAYSTHLLWNQSQGKKQKVIEKYASELTDQKSFDKAMVM